MADEALVLKGVDDLHDGKFSLQKLIELTIEFEKHAARIHALSTCIRDGSLYQVKDTEGKAKIATLKHYAYLHYILDAFKAIGDDLKKAANAALKGDDDKKGTNGHAERFAEFMQEQGMSSFKNDALGTFYTKRNVEVIPPGKYDEEKYAAFTAWLSAHSDELMTKPSMSWTSLQKLGKELVENEKLPDFFSTKERRIIQLRKS